MNNQQISDNADEIIENVHEIVAKLHKRAVKIDFEKDEFSEAAINDLKLHLGYTRAYSDLAKVKLQYYKVLKDEDKKYEDGEVSDL